MQYPVLSCVKTGARLSVRGYFRPLEVPDKVVRAQATNVWWVEVLTKSEELDNDSDVRVSAPASAFGTNNDTAKAVSTNTKPQKVLLCSRCEPSHRLIVNV